MANDVSHFYVRDDPTKYAFDDADAEERITDETTRAETAEQSNAENIGTLSSLTTTAKSNLVAAINEVDANVDALNSKIADSGWKTLTLNSAFTLYSSNTPVQYRKVGNLVELFGVIKPTAEIAAGGTATIGTLPAGYYPNVGHSFVCQGSSINRWMLTVSGGGVLNFSRYGASSGAAAGTNAWLPFNVMFFVN